MASHHARERGVSFDHVNTTEASGVLANVLDKANAYIGGCSIGPGLKKAARHYFDQKQKSEKDDQDVLLEKFPGAVDLNNTTNNGLKVLLEDPFYVVDIGVVVSQVYQWRRFFPRIEPFYAIKCNPDPVIVQTLAILGCNFDCASRNEIRLVQDVCCRQDLCKRQPDIIFANPCKPVSHLIEAVARGVRLVTFDNATEVVKCANVSSKIELVLRIITDDRGSQCRLSSKYGAPRSKWRPLLAAAKHHGLTVVGVSFHVGSGCRDSSKYLEPLQDAREIFDMAETEFGMNMHLLDIGGGFPGETHSIWNPVVEIDEDDGDTLEGKPSNDNGEDSNRFMFFQEIAQKVAPMIDDLFPPESGVRIISEPGRYFTAAAATLCCSVISCRSNEMDESFQPEPVNDKQAAKQVDAMTRQDERELVRTCSGQLDSQKDDDEVMATIQEELRDYSKLFTAQQLAQQEVDVYNDSLDWFQEGFETAIDMLGPPDKQQKHHRTHTVEGITYPLVAATGGGDDQDSKTGAGGLLPATLSAAGEAAVKGVVLQAMADSAPLQDDFAYYINDGIYGAFNNIMYDHASVRPRVLRASLEGLTSTENGFGKLESVKKETLDKKNGDLYASTVFGPTCDGIDIVARSVLLPKLKVGDWMYFENMGAYTMAAASSFNGFSPSEKLYCCSVMPEYFEEIIAGPEARKAAKKKERESDKQDGS